MEIKKTAPREKNTAESKSFTFSDAIGYDTENTRRSWWLRVKNHKYFSALLPLGLVLVLALWNEWFADSPAVPDTSAVSREVESAEVNSLPEQNGELDVYQQSDAEAQNIAEPQDGEAADAAYQDAQQAKVPEVATPSQASNDPATNRPARCEFKADQGPEMLVIPGGVFPMGRAQGEPGGRSNEKPQHVVTVQPFALSRCEVSVAEFTLFIEATGYITSAERGAGCRGIDSANGRWHMGANWRQPGFVQEENSPVVCVSQQDISRYLQWLSARLGAEYRLPSEAEWEFAARAGRSERLSFPETEWCRYANIAANCEDGFAYTAPVASFFANAFGLFDMHGNVFEWVGDCWHDNYTGAPNNGSAWGEEEDGNCQQGVVRGGAWQSEEAQAHSAYRTWCQGESCAYVGFRLARTLQP